MNLSITTANPSINISLFAILGKVQSEERINITIHAVLIGTSYAAIKVFSLLFDDRNNLLFLHNDE